ncbi:MAG: hypothetical protein QOJ68_3643 [Blastococcus sp.]|nr:hypothetical protein [Blastococcus sp.]
MHTVWLAEWQWACCGEPFSVGTPVRWNLEKVVPDHRVTAKLRSLLSAEVADRVTHEEDHHGMHASGAETAGVVRSITAVYARSAPTSERHGPHGMVGYAEVPGSGVIEQWQSSRPAGRRPAAAGTGALDHVGWLVELEV